MTILQIVPDVPPAVNGLGDYAAALSKALKQTAAIDSAFFIPSPASLQTHLAELGKQSSAIEPPNVLLQYVGYAYDKRGAPAWLPTAIARARQRNPSMRLFTMFHELYAFGPPWRSSFWLSPLQRHIAKRILRLSHGVVTNCPLARNILQRWAPGRDIHVMPTPSTIGESHHIPSFSERAPVLAVFGQQIGRANAWRALAETPQIISHLGIQEIWDIGPGNVHTPPLEGVRTHSFGERTHDQIRQLLLRARFGLIANPWHRLCRSSVLAACMSHGLVPIVHTQEEDSCPTLDPMRHFLRPRLITGPLPDDRLTEIAAAARAWYSGHAIHEHARLFASLIEGRHPA